AIWRRRLVQLVDERGLVRVDRHGLAELRQRGVGVRELNPRLSVFLRLLAGGLVVGLRRRQIALGRAQILKLGMQGQQPERRDYRDQAGTAEKVTVSLRHPVVPEEPVLPVGPVEPVAPVAPAGKACAPAADAAGPVALK